MSIEYFQTFCLSSARIALVPLEMGHASHLQVIGTPEVFRYIPQIQCPFDAQAWIRMKLESTSPLMAHVAVEKRSGAVIGFLQFEIAAGASGYVYELGYWFGRDYWGQKFGTEATLASLVYILDRIAQFETATL